MDTSMYIHHHNRDTEHLHHPKVLPVPLPANPHTYPLLRAISNLLPIILYKLNHTICILWCLASYVFYCEVSIKVFALFCFVTEFLEFFIHLDASLKLATHLLQIDFVCLFLKGLGLALLPRLECSVYPQAPSHVIGMGVLTCSISDLGPFTPP